MASAAVTNRSIRVGASRRKRAVNRLFRRGADASSAMPLRRRSVRRKPHLWGRWRLIRGFASLGAVTMTHPNERRGGAEGAPTDVELVARMARGDKPALAQLYDRFSPTLLALGTRMLADRREAEDLVHDVFI